MKELEKELAEVRQAEAIRLEAEKKTSYNEGFDIAEAAYEKQVDGIFETARKSMPTEWVRPSSSGTSAVWMLCPWALKPLRGFLSQMI